MTVNISRKFQRLHWQIFCEFWISIRRKMSLIDLVFFVFLGVRCLRNAKINKFHKFFRLFHETESRYFYLYQLCLLVKNISIDGEKEKVDNHNNNEKAALGSNETWKASSTDLENVSSKMGQESKGNEGAWRKINVKLVNRERFLGRTSSSFRSKPLQA